MATQSKKTNSTSSQNTSGKRRRRRSKKKSTFKKSIYIVLAVFLMILLVAFGYFLGRNANASSQTPIAQTYKTYETDSKKELLDALAKIEAQKTVEKKTVAKPIIQEKREEEKVVKKDEPAEVKTDNRVRLVESTGRPKLVIIIDDVSNKSQLNKLKATGIKVTPSIFPPSERSMTSHTLADELQHYLIHLPMESGSVQFNKQAKTLITNFSKAQIEARVKELRTLFPHARYINNHTGSVFTDDHDAMQILYAALRKEGFVFVDSRTIASTKVPAIVEQYGDAYVARDVFIDNEHNVPYIHKQLEKAVNIAKKKGYAIAIGHPHKMTLKALASAKSIFNDVDLVYIDELYQ